ncbi:MAG: type II toxin-antitoxin system VapC family toxin [Chloroflexota bacterium]
MTIYTDTIILGSVYLTDEANSAWITEVELTGTDPVVTSQLTDVEMAGLFRRAHDDGRVTEPEMHSLLRRYATDTADDGPIAVLKLTPALLQRAVGLILRVGARSPDVIHLAAAAQLGEQTGESVALLTADIRQARAARTLGLPLHPRSPG